MTVAASHSSKLSDDKVQKLPKIIGLALIDMLDSGQTDPAALQGLALSIVNAHLLYDH